MQSGSRDYRLFLEDIRDGCRKIVDWTASISFDDFVGDAQLYDAVLYNLHVLGEAVKHLPDEVRDRHPAVPWRGVAGFRDVAAHFYFGLSNALVWDIVQNNVSELLDQIETVIAAEEAAGDSAR